MKHPLINPKSTHYQDGGKPAIQRIEENLSLMECIGFSRGNIIKYQYRAKLKGQEQQDIEKLESYKAYYAFLLEILIDNEINKADVHYLTLSQLYKELRIDIDYSID